MFIQQWPFGMRVSSWGSGGQSHQRLAQGWIAPIWGMAVTDNNCLTVCELVMILCEFQNLRIRNSFYRIVFVLSFMAKSHDVFFKIYVLVKLLKMYRNNIGTQCLGQIYTPARFCHMWSEITCGLLQRWIFLVIPSHPWRAYFFSSRAEIFKLGCFVQIYSDLGVSCRNICQVPFRNTQSEKCILENGPFGILWCSTHLGIHVADHVPLLHAPRAKQGVLMTTRKQLHATGAGSGKSHGHE